MLPELTNLLSEERVRAFRRRYFFRFATLAAFSGVLLIGAHTALLSPTSILLSSQIAVRQAQLAELTASGASSDEAAFQARLAALAKSTTQIQAVGAAPSVVVLLGEILAIPRGGIAISGFSFTPANGKKPATVMLAGMASTRDNLRQYQLALQSASFIASADLPVSTYAKDTQIPFSVTVSLTTP